MSYKYDTFKAKIIEMSNDKTSKINDIMDKEWILIVPELILNVLKELEYIDKLEEAGINSEEYIEKEYHKMAPNSNYCICGQYIKHKRHIFNKITKCYETVGKDCFLKKTTKYAKLIEDVDKIYKHIFPCNICSRPFYAKKCLRKGYIQKTCDFCRDSYVSYTNNIIRTYLYGERYNFMKKIIDNRCAYIKDIKEFKYLVNAINDNKFTKYMNIESELYIKSVDYKDDIDEKEYTCNLCATKYKYTTDNKNKICTKCYTSYINNLQKHIGIMGNKNIVSYINNNYIDIWNGYNNTTTKDIDEIISFIGKCVICDKKKEENSDSKYHSKCYDICYDNYKKHTGTIHQLEFYNLDNKSLKLLYQDKLVPSLKCEVCEKYYYNLYKKVLCERCYHDNIKLLLEYIENKNIYFKHKIFLIDILKRGKSLTEKQLNYLKDILKQYNDDILSTIYKYLE